PQQQPRQRRRQEVRERPRDHGAEPEPRQVVLTVRRERADAADLYADRADVGEPAQREGGDGERYRVELPAERSEILVRDELVQHHALAQQAPDRSAVVPRPAPSTTFTSVRGISTFTPPRVSGVSVSGSMILAIMIVPGAVMITAVSRWRASIPNAM